MCRTSQFPLSHSRYIIFLSFLGQLTVYWRQQKWRNVHISCVTNNIDRVYAKTINSHKNKSHSNCNLEVHNSLLLCSLCHHALLANEYRSNHHLSSVCALNECENKYFTPSRVTRNRNNRKNKRSVTTDNQLISTYELNYLRQDFSHYMGHSLAVFPLPPLPLNGRGYGRGHGAGMVADMVAGMVAAYLSAQIILRHQFNHIDALLNSHLKNFMKPHEYVMLSCYISFYFPKLFILFKTNKFLILSEPHRHF